MAKSWKRKYYDLRNKKYKKKTGIQLPSIAQVVLGLVGGSMIVGPTVRERLADLDPLGAANSFVTDRVPELHNDKTRVVVGLGLMSLPTFARRLMGWRKNSTRIMKIGPAAVDVL